MSNELFERLKKYQMDLKDRVLFEETGFLEEVEKGSYPAKCFRCYQIGIRFCRWWSKKFECEQYDAEKNSDITKAFYNKTIKKKKNYCNESMKISIMVKTK